MEHAAALELLHRDTAIAAVANQVCQEHDPSFDGVHCIEPDCGDEIPEGRLALGKIRCVACQAWREKRLKEH